jgi:RNA polymerase sigma factor (sigma-70 family)
MPDLNDHKVAAMLVENRRVFLGFLTHRLPSRADAEDVLQDFYIKALSRQNQLREADSLLAWLYALLRSTLIDHYRKADRRSRGSQAYARETRIAVWADETDGLHDELCACLHALLPTLRPDQAELVRRVDLGEEDRASIAADFGISLATLAVRLYRARQALYRALLASCASCCEHGFDDCTCVPDKAKALEQITNS